MCVTHICAISFHKPKRYANEYSYVYSRQCTTHGIVSTLVMVNKQTLKRVLPRFYDGGFAIVTHLPSVRALKIFEIWTTVEINSSARANRVGQIILYKLMLYKLCYINGWNIWLSTGLDQFMIKVENIRLTTRLFDIPVFCTSVVETIY